VGNIGNVWRHQASVMKTRTQLIRISGVAIVLQCRRPAWNRPQRSEALFCVRVIFALIVASVLRKLARMRVWFCGVTLVDARQSVYASVNYALPIARGSWLGGWEISGINSIADRSATHGNGVPQVYGFTGTATAARSGQA
jgi:hypothetical protein